MRRSERRPRSILAGRPVAHARRMLAVVALAGSATLLAACAAPGTAPSSAPPQPTGAGAAGAAPAELSDALLQGEGLFDEVGSEGYAVRWLEPGTSIAVVIGGSGGGGGCIPQPHAAELDASTQHVVVRFDPPDPAMICTADFRLHGWELALASTVDASAPLTVELVNLRGEDESTEVEIGPDDLLSSGPTADPQPSLIPTTPGAVPAPTAIPAEQLPSLMDAEPGLVQTEDPEVGVRWIEPGVRLAVLRYGSGAPHCSPTPVGARSTGIGMIEVSFEFASDDRDCSADGMLRGWDFTLPERVPATLPVEVTVTGASPLGATAVLTLQPDDLLEIP